MININFEWIITVLHGFLTDYGTVGIFVGSIVEEIIAPIPSTAVIFLGSAFILNDKLISIYSFFDLFLYIALPAALGMTIGSLFIYLITYYVGKPFIDKWGKFLGLYWEDINLIKEKYKDKKSDDLVIFILRAIPIVPSIAITSFCGIIRYPLKKYMIITLIGSLIRAMIIGFLGWQFGKAYNKISSTISQLESIVIIIVVIVVIAYIVHSYKNKKSERDIKKGNKENNERN